MRDELTNIIYAKITKMEGKMQEYVGLGREFDSKLAEGELLQADDGGEDTAMCYNFIRKKHTEGQRHEGLLPDATAASRPRSFASPRWLSVSTGVAPGRRPR